MTTDVTAQETDGATIFYNGKIFTSNPFALIVQAVAIKDDKILAAGDLAPVQRKAGKNPKMIDIKGKCLIPGLIDSHNHAVSGGASLLTAHLNDHYLDEDSLSSYAQYAIRTGKGLRGDMLFIQGLHSSTWKDLETLKKIFEGPDYSNKAVALRGSDGHTSWVNKNMLRQAGINGTSIKSLPETEQKFFGVDVAGEPNGLIAESGFQYVEKAMPPSSVKPLASLSEGIRHLNRLGITAWMDPSAGSVYDGLNNPLLLAYQEVSQANSLTAHVTCVIRADANEAAEHQIELAKKWQTAFATNANVTIAGFKIFADGVMEFPTQTASMLTPYSNSGLAGSQMVDPEKLKKFVIAADRENLLVHVHTIGDRAVREALDAIEAARSHNKNKNLPHSLTHLQCIHSDDLRRFSELNVPACMQLFWATADAYTDELVKPYIDEAAYTNMYPANSILRRRGTVCGASDWPVSSANPFEAIYRAETRAGKFGILNSNEIMKRKDLLMAYTIHAAKAILRDKIIGSIEVGKQADLVLLDRDVLTVSPEQIKDTQVLWTMFGGKIVYEKQQ